MILLHLAPDLLVIYNIAINYDKNNGIYFDKSLMVVSSLQSLIG